MSHSISADEIAALKASGQFDEQWYCERYPDVRASGMDPAEHYLWIGQRLGRLGAADSDLSVRMPSVVELPESYGFKSIRTFKDFSAKDFLFRLRNRNECEDFWYSPKISVLLPVYKSPIRFLDMAISSVLNQSYKNWELVIVDDGSNSSELDQYLRGIDVRGGNVKIIVNRENGGISKATNCALREASGDFIALFDHDDILTLDALEKNVRVLNDFPALDLIYSDECRVDESDIPLDLFRKPDWSESMMYNYMYTGHFSIYRRSIVERVGGFRSEYDFSQDYDLALRVTELTSRIHHLPEIVYGWRAIAGSGAAGGKDYARETNIAALQDAMRRRNISGTAVPLPTANRIDRLASIGSPLVSIIIPSDNAKHISESVESIKCETSYVNYEILIVTNSKICSQLRFIADGKTKFVPFDKVFNFSEKCNVGAYAANGDYLCFFNDDVRPIDQNWIECLLEYGELSDVGAVGAKLLYEDGLIQHAGMVTGVRGLVGTAFHCLPDNTSEHFNMAQCVRDVSLLCGALILMPRSVFAAIGGWDEVDFSIGHSDVDLCLKVWKLGMRCVYTPHAKLCHIGHVSIGNEEKKEKKRKVDKADIALLRKWPDAIANDPYFTYPMKRQVFHDSQEDYRIFPGGETEVRGGRDVLIVSHEMSRSGAPMVVVQMATILKRAGYFVVVMAPEDGAAIQYLNNIGVTVIVDELVLTGHETFKKFAANFDIVIGNTVVAWQAVASVSGLVPTVAYLHEGDFMRDKLAHDRRIGEALAGLTGCWAVSHVSARALDTCSVPYDFMPYGFDVSVDGRNVLREVASQTKVAVLGSYETRKGQDLAVEAAKILASNPCIDFRLICHGRMLDRNFFEGVSALAGNHEFIHLGGELDHAQSVELIDSADILLVSSRDDPLPIVATEAMALGKVLVVPAQVGTAGHIIDGVNGFISESSSPEHLAQTLERAFAQKERWVSIGRAAQQTYLGTFTLSSFGERLIQGLEQSIQMFKADNQC